MDNLGDSKRTQLEMLQTRLGLHGTRMWQLPLTYLGFIAICMTTLTTEEKVFPTSFLFILLAVLGVIMTWCLYGADRRYQQTAADARELEKELQLKTYTSCDGYHTYPYYALMAFGMVCSTATSLYLVFVLVPAGSS